MATGDLWGKKILQVTFSNKFPSHGLSNPARLRMRCFEQVKENHGYLPGKPPVTMALTPWLRRDINVARKTILSNGWARSIVRNDLGIRPLGESSEVPAY